MKHHRSQTGYCGLGWSRRALLTAGGLSLAACSSGRQPPRIQDLADTGTGELTATSLRPLLDRRVQALRAGDERAFLADLDPSGKELIEQQKMIFANLRQLRLTDHRYITERIIGGPVREGDVYHFGPVHEVLQLSADAGPGGVSPAATFRFTVVQRDGKLMITAITGVTRTNREKLQIDGLKADAPWYLTPLRVQHSGNVCLIGDTSVTDLDRYAGPAEAEARTVEALWGDRTRFPGHVLFFTRKESSFAAWFSLGASDNFQPTVEGFSIPQYGVRQNGEIYTEQFAGSRMVVNLPRIEQFGDDPRLVMRHELAHAISSRAVTVGGLWLLGAPRWAQPPAGPSSPIWRTLCSSTGESSGTRRGRGLIRTPLRTMPRLSAGSGSR